MKRYGHIFAALAALALVVAVFFYFPGLYGLPKPVQLPATVQPAPEISTQPPGMPAEEPVTRMYAYVLRGENGTVRLDLDPDLYNRLAAGSPPTVCLAPVSGTDPCPAAEIARYYRCIIDRPEEKPYLDALVQAVREKTDVQDDQARIAISLVQQIPYGYNQSYARGNGNLRSPYMVLYDNSGICDEKSLLLAYLLNELGYGVALFSFPDQQHTAAGIRSPLAFSSNNTGYAFVETTFPAIITDDLGEYGDAGRLAGPPVMYPIADGASFDSVSSEYTDAREFIRLRDLVRTGEGRLTGTNRTEAQALCHKYGLYSCTT
jgi:hypothetical protein